MTELNKLRMEFKYSMLEGNWDKAIGISKKIEEIEPSNNGHFLCESYDDSTGKCSETLFFTFFQENI